MTNPLFYAKILLFGEYGIIEDSQGLTVPYSFYKGTLKFSDLKSEFEKKSNLSLKNYSDYLMNVELDEKFKLNIAGFQKDISLKAELESLPFSAYLFIKIFSLI